MVQDGRVGVGIREIGLQFEAHAIELCSRENLSRKLVSDIIYIDSDGQTTLKTLHASSYCIFYLHLSVSKFIWNCLLRLEELARQNVVTDVEARSLWHFW